MKQTKTKENIKKKRLILTMFLVLSLFGVGYFFEENLLLSLAFLVMGLGLGVKLDSYNNQLEYGEFKK